MGGQLGTASGLQGRALNRAGAALAGLIAAMAMSGSAGAGSSAEAVYTVANYPVEARAKDAVTAKNTAIADGQQAAFRSLLRRIVPVTAYRRLKAMPPVKAADLVDGVSVKAERNSSTEYIATLDFAFQAAGVRDVLRRNNIPFIDTQAPQTVVVPVLRTEGAGIGEGAKGVWFEAWKGLDLQHALAPVVLFDVKPEVTADTIKTVIAGTGGAERTLAQAYKSDRVIIALAEKTADGKRLSVTLAGSDAAGPFVLKRNYRISGGDLAYTTELAAVVSLGILEGRWKAAKAGALGGVDVIAGRGEAIAVRVEFGTIAEWNEIRNKLLETDGVLDVAVGAVSARSADVDLRFPGGAAQLADALAARGLAMNQGGGGWTVRSSF
jgi:Uncharacterized protein conserved in bacteria (DUF2066)